MKLFSLAHKVAINCTIKSNKKYTRFIVQNYLPKERFQYNIWSVLRWYCSWIFYYLVNIVFLHLLITTTLYYKYNSSIFLRKPSFHDPSIVSEYCNNICYNMNDKVHKFQSNQYNVYFYFILQKYANERKCH